VNSGDTKIDIGASATSRCDLCFIGNIFTESIVGFALATSICVLPVRHDARWPLHPMVDFQKDARSVIFAKCHEVHHVPALADDGSPRFNELTFTQSSPSSVEYPAQDFRG